MPSIKVAYSPSGKSVCKKCLQRIHAQSIRIGYQQMSSGYVSTMWFHEKCFSKQNMWGILEDDIEGMNELCQADKNRLSDLFEKLLKEKERDNKNFK